MRATPAILFQRILEVQPDFDELDPALDLLDINWKDLDRRALAGRSRSGRPVRLVLGAGQKLAHGAVLWRDQDRRLIVNLLSCQVIVIDSLRPLKLARLAYAIGNLHLPAEIGRNQIVLPADEPTEAAIGRLNVRYSIDSRRIHPITDYLPRITVALNTTD
jgi:urease accessory protein UreE